MSCRLFCVWCEASPILQGWRALYIDQVNRSFQFGLHTRTHTELCTYWQYQYKMTTFLPNVPLYVAPSYERHSDRLLWSDCRHPHSVYGGEGGEGGGLHQTSPPKTCNTNFWHHFNIFILVFTGVGVILCCFFWLFTRVHLPQNTSSSIQCIRNPKWTALVMTKTAVSLSVTDAIGRTTQKKLECSENYSSLTTMRGVVLRRHFGASTGGKPLQGRCQLCGYFLLFAGFTAYTVPVIITGTPG